MTPESCPACGGSRTVVNGANGSVTWCQMPHLNYVLPNVNVTNMLPSITDPSRTSMTTAYVPAYPITYWPPR